MLTTGFPAVAQRCFRLPMDLATANTAKAWLEQHYLTEVGGFAHVCRLDEQGTRVGVD